MQSVLSYIYGYNYNRVSATTVLISYSSHNFSLTSHTLHKKEKKNLPEKEEQSGRHSLMGEWVR